MLTFLTAEMVSKTYLMILHAVEYSEIILQQARWAYSLQIFSALRALA